jgi:Ca2+:H+ antiporter
MNWITSYLRRKPIAILLIAVPMAIIADLLKVDPIIVFAISSIEIIPFASYIGESTESLAHYTGPRIGGLLNATLGNAAELIIAIIAIRERLLDLVKASITGSILGNLPLVLGMAFVLGGVRNGVQAFDRRHATRYAILLVLAVIILLVPSLLSAYIGDIEGPSLKVEALSLGVAAK